MRTRELFSKASSQNKIFYLILSLSLFICGWPSALFQEQSELHLWRQSDCLSLTEYYAKGNGFFTPEMHCLLSDSGTTGKTISEFPLVYFIVGKLWAVFGVQLWIYRLLSMLVSIVALTLLYKTVLKITGNWFWSVMAPLLLLCSPIYVFYGIGFLTNIYAFNIVIIGWYFFYKYYCSGKDKMLLITMLLFGLAGLLKVSSLLSFFMLATLFFLESIRLVVFREGGIFRNKKMALLFFIIPSTFFLIWYKGFVAYYTQKHGGIYSFTQPVPVWSYTAHERGNIWKSFVEYTLQQIFPTYLWFFFLTAMFYLFFNYRKVNKVFLLGMPLLLIGHVAFMMLFYFSLDGHDYYHIDLLIYFLFVYCAFVKTIDRIENVALQARVTRVFFVLFLLYGLLGSGSNMQMRFHGCQGGEQAFRQIFANKREIELFTMYADNYSHKRVYKKVGEELRRRGFKDNVPIISFNDGSFNSTLFLMDRPGYTNMSDVFSDSTWNAKRILMGARLLAVENPEQESRGVIAFMGYKLFQIEHIAVYDLRPYVEELRQK